MVKRRCSSQSPGFAWPAVALRWRRRRRRRRRPGRRRHPKLVADGRHDVPHHAGDSGTGPGGGSRRLLHRVTKPRQQAGGVHHLPGRRSLEHVRRQHAVRHVRHVGRTRRQRRRQHLHQLVQQPGGAQQHAVVAVNDAESAPCLQRFLEQHVRGHGGCGREVAMHACQTHRDRMTE